MFPFFFGDRSLCIELGRGELSRSGVSGRRHVFLHRVCRT